MRFVDTIGGPILTDQWLVLHPSRSQLHSATSACAGRACWSENGGVGGAGAAAAIAADSGCKTHGPRWMSANAGLAWRGDGATGANETRAIGARWCADLFVGGGHVVVACLPRQHVGHNSPQPSNSQIVSKQVCRCRRCKGRSNALASAPAPPRLSLRSLQSRHAFPCSALSVSLVASGAAPRARASCHLPRRACRVPRRVAREPD